MNSLHDCFKALDYCNELFGIILNDLEISLVVLFGSAVYPGCFNIKTSDLDILAITDLSTSKLNTIKNVIDSRISLNDSYKKAVVIKDHVGDRVEFALSYKDIVLDCTIMHSLLPKREILMSTAIHDSADVLMGAIVEHGIVLIGNDEKLKEQGKEYEPYYDNELRAKRLSDLSGYLRKKVSRIKEFLRDNNPDVIDYFFKYRVVFLKYLFCFYQKYPVNYHKHLDYQIETILNLPANDKRIILMNSSSNWKESIGSFLEYYESCLPSGL